MIARYLPSIISVLILAAATFVMAQSPPVISPKPPIPDPMSQLLRQASGENEIIVDAEFDPPVVAEGEPAIFRIVVTAEPGAVDLPERIPVPVELEIKKGGVGRSFVSKGQLTQSRTTFNYSVAARKTGVFAIASFPASFGGQRIAVPSRTLQVVAAGSPEAQRPASLRVEIPDGEFFVGQAVRLRVVALDPGDSSVFGLTEPKALGDAFLFDRIPGSQRRELRTEEGRSVSALIEEIIAIPVSEGRLTLSAQAFIDRRRAADSQGVQLPGYRPFLESDRVQVVVRHLPGGALPGFTGLIGQFKRATPMPAAREVRAGDPLKLSVAIEGEGNLGRLVPPLAPESSVWRVLPPVADGTSPSIIAQRGSNVFHYTLIPRYAGMTTTPKIPFCYFDPAQNQYVDLTIPSISILVLAPPGGQAAMQNTNASAAPIASATDALGKIASHPVHFKASLLPVQQNRFFWALQLTLGGLLTALCWRERRRRYLIANPSVVCIARARRALRRQERRRRRAAAEHDAMAYSQAAVASLRESCAPHIKANPDALVCDDVIRVASAMEWDGSNGEGVRQLFRIADEAAFKGKPINPEKLWVLQPELELLIAKLRNRLQ